MQPFSLASIVQVLCLPCASHPREEVRPSGEVLITTTETYELESGAGAEICMALDDVHELLAGQQYLEAATHINYMLSEFIRFEAPARQVLSFRSDYEYRDYLDSSSNPENVFPVDWCYHELFQLKAFVHASQEDFDKALLLLAKSSDVGPIAAAPFVEQGYVFNRLGRFEEARDSYEEAIRLVGRYPLSSPQLPMALRGLGFALIELGDLDGAERAFLRSLEIDSENELAAAELKYIDSLRQRRR